MPPPLLRNVLSSLLRLPVRYRSVVAEYLVSPGSISHVRPIVLVKSGSILQLLFVDIQNKDLLVFIHSERAPRYSKELVTHAEESAEGQDGIGDLTSGNVDHDFVYFSKVVSG